MKESFGCRVFPYSNIKGTTVSWNAVVYDMTQWKDLPSGRMYSFVTMTAPFPSQRQAQEGALRLCRRYSMERRVGVFERPRPIRG